MLTRAHSHRYAHRRWKQPALGVLAAAVATVFAGAAEAQVVFKIRTDGSVGPAAQDLARVGSTYTIPQTLGKLSGNNLFHSFETFNLSFGQTANFTTTTAALANVISRVTGGASTINGRLRLSAAGGGAPSFFFINPAGVTFGNGASIDVPGAFHVSTANYLKFPDGNFYADTTTPSTFSSAAPEAFGFLGETRATVAVNAGAHLMQTGTKPLSIVAGDVTVRGVVNTQSGDVRALAVGLGAGEVALTGALPAGLGNVSVLNGGEISSATGSGLNGGSVNVGGGNLTVDGQASSFAGIFSLTEGAGNAGIVEVSAIDALSIKRGGFVASGSFSGGYSGAVKASAGSIALDQGFIFSDSIGAGNAGPIDVSVLGNLSILNGSTISSDARSTGNGASVKVNVGGNIELNRGRIYSDAHNSGNAGTIEVTALGNFSALNGGRVSSAANSSGDAGSLKVSAESIVIDGQGGGVTGITSHTAVGTGNAGNIEVATGSLSVLNGGQVSSSTFSSGNAGSVKVNAESIVIDKQRSFAFTAITSQAAAGTGNAGSVDVTATGGLFIVNGGEISSSSFSSGDAGSVKINAGSILIDRQGSSSATGIGSQSADGTGNAGTVEVTAVGGLSVLNGGRIDSRTLSLGNAGSVKVNAASIVLDGRDSVFFTGISSEAITGSTGHAGNIEVATTGSISMLNAGGVSSSTFSSGNAGSVKINAGNIVIDGQGRDFSTGITGVTSQAERTSTGNAGNIEIAATDNLSVVNGGRISSSTFSSGKAGSVKVRAGSIVIDGRARGDSTFIASFAGRESTGNAGSVDVGATGDLLVLSGGRITSDTVSTGDGGIVKVAAANIVIDEQGSGFLTGIETGAGEFSTGNAGSVTVSATSSLAVLNGGEISSSTYSAGNGGTVKVAAGRIVIDRQGSPFVTGIFSDAVPGSSGNAGSVDVAVAGSLLIQNGGQVSSNTQSTGDAGSVEVTAGSIVIDGQRRGVTTGISSEARPGSTGNAGSVEVAAAAEIAILRGAISSATFSSGAAGSVKVSAGSVQVDGPGSSINASAAGGSSGQTGSVHVTASQGITLSNAGSISISNDATVADPSKITPTTLTVSAPDITLKDAQITAASSGNVAASDVQVLFTNHLFLDPSSITTSANLGDGGDITIRGGRLITLENSQITTSVSGLTGNGGDISISAQTLFLLTGFIQANTAAANASGGTVTIDVQNLVASGNSLLLGGDVASVFQPGVFGFNVIQAAAPTGVSGVVQLTTPLLDVAGSLSGLSAQVIEAGGLGRNPCQVSGGGSLTQAGRGGLAPSARGVLGAAPMAIPVTLGGEPEAARTLVTAAGMGRCQ